MKKILALMLAAGLATATLIPAEAAKPARKNIIEARIDSLPYGKVTVMVWDGIYFNMFETTAVAGKFVFENDSVRGPALLMFNAGDPYRGEKLFQCLLDGNRVKVRGTYGDMTGIRVKGSPAYDEYLAMERQIAALCPPDTAAPQYAEGSACMLYSDADVEIALDVCRATLQRNPKSLAAVVQMLAWANTRAVSGPISQNPSLREIMALADPALHSSNFWKQLDTTVVPAEGKSNR